MTKINGPQATKIKPTTTPLLNFSTQATMPKGKEKLINSCQQSYQALFKNSANNSVLQVLKQAIESM